MRNLNQKILSTGNATQTLETAAIDASQLYRTSLQFVFSNAGCTGNVYLQGSNDLISPTHWNNVANAAVAAGGNVLIPTTELSYQYIRARFVPTAGAGTLNIFINAQGF